MANFDSLNDEQMNGVSGGAGVTKWGFPYDDKGTVTYTDQQGNSLRISAADWKWLLTQYSGPNNDPESYLKTVPAKDLSIILNQHHGM